MGCQQLLLVILVIPFPIFYTNACSALYQPTLVYFIHVILSCMHSFSPSSYFCNLPFSSHLLDNSASNSSLLALPFSLLSSSLPQSFIYIKTSQLKYSKPSETSNPSLFRNIVDSLRKHSFPSFPRWLGPSRHQILACFNLFIAPRKMIYHLTIQQIQKANSKSILYNAISHFSSKPQRQPPHPPSSPFLRGKSPPLLSFPRPALPSLSRLKQRGEIINKQMSHIIDKPKQNYFCHFTKRRQQRLYNGASRSVHTQNGNGSLTRGIEQALKHSQTAFFTVQGHSAASIVAVEPYELGRPLLGVPSFSVSSVREEVNIKVDILSNNQHYFRIESLDHRLQLNRTLVFGRHSPPFKLFKVHINLTNGRLRLSLPLHFLFETAALRKGSVLRRKLVLHNLMGEILLEAKSVLDWLKRQRREEQPVARKHQLAHELSRLSQMMGVYKKVSESNEVMTEKTIREYKLKQMQSVRDLLAGKVPPEQRLLRSMAAYVVPGLEYELKTEEDCQLNAYQMQVIKKSVVPMRRSNGGEPQQSLMLSHIYINRPEAVRLKPMMSGGFSSIFLAEIEYCYVDASRFKEEEFLACKDRKWQRNRVVVKKETVGLQPGLAGRNKHEKEIIEKMKNSSSYMLNRYYCPLNSAAAFNRSDIVMDHIPFPTLKEFMVLGKQSCSLVSKLTVMLAVVQALRSVNRFDVVHLDLKPNNILLNPDLQVKLLDFGESYHPEVEKFKPGFTIPYACPEVHSGCSEFSIKSDLYSFGILLFQLLYRRHPLYFHQDSNLKKYRTAQYLEHWFYYPEAAEFMGQKNVYGALNILISRCLEKDPARRPELVTVGLMLQQCIRVLSD